MTDPSNENDGPKMSLSENGDSDDRPDILPFRKDDDTTRASMFSVLSLQSPDRAAVLAQRRKEGKDSKETISPHDFDLNRLWWLNGGDDEDAEPTPLTRSQLAHSTGEQAVVLTSAECGILGRLSFIDCYGRRHDLDLRAAVSEGATFILFPEDLGETEGKPSSTRY